MAFKNAGHFLGRLTDKQVCWRISVWPAASKQLWRSVSSWTIRLPSSSNMMGVEVLEYWWKKSLCAGTVSPNRGYTWSWECFAHHRFDFIIRCFACSSPAVQTTAVFISNNVRDGPPAVLSNINYFNLRQNCFSTAVNGQSSLFLFKLSGSASRSIFFMQSNQKQLHLRVLWSA